MEILPGVHWIRGPLNPDYMKTNNISIVFGDKSTPSKFYKYVHAHSRDCNDIDKLVTCVSKLYMKNIMCALSFDREDTLGFIMSRLLNNVCKITHIDDIHEIVHMNYNVNLSEKQRLIIAGVNT